MRTAALISALVAALVAAGATLVPRVGDAARTLTVARAAKGTLGVSRQRFATDVQIVKNAQRYVLHVRGAAAPGTLAVRVRVEAERIDGTLAPIASGAEMLDGPFLYQQAPNGMVVNGTVRWLRLRVASLPPASPMLAGLHDMSAEPLLRVLEVAQMPAHGSAAGVFRGTVPYDDPVVVASLSQLTNKTQFRHLRLTAVVGHDGLVHRLRLTGRTADGSATLRIDSRLYAFGRPVHVAQPQQRSFLDQQDGRLAA
jgi:hypothetical protein